MRGLLRRLPSPAMVVACTALAVALSGTGYALTKLPRNSVGTAQLKKNAVVSSKVRDASLRAADFAPGQLPAGPQGPPGPPGSDAQFNGTLPAVRAFHGSRVFEGTACISAVTDNTERALCYLAESYDTDSMHTSGTTAEPASKLVAPRAGLYAVTAGMIWTSDDVDGSRQLTIKKNGGQYVAAEQIPAGPAGNNTIQNVHGTVRLSAGDYVQAFAWQNSGADLNLYGFADERSFFEMHWIGP